MTTALPGAQMLHKRAVAQDYARQHNGSVSRDTFNIYIPYGDAVLQLVQNLRLRREETLQLTERVYPLRPDWSCFRIVGVVKGKENVPPSGEEDLQLKKDEVYFHMEPRVFWARRMGIKEEGTLGEVGWAAQRHLEPMEQLFMTPEERNRHRHTSKILVVKVSDVLGEETAQHLKKILIPNAGGWENKCRFEWIRKGFESRGIHMTGIGVTVS